MPKDLLYRPELGYKKDYYTEGNINNINSENNTNSNIEESSVSKEEIIDQLLIDINNQISFLPNQLIDIYLPPYIGMKYEYESIKKDYNDNDTDSFPSDDKEENVIDKEVIDKEVIDKDKYPIKDNDKNNDNDKDNDTETGIIVETPNNDDFDQNDIPDDLFDRIDDFYINVEDPISNPAQIIKDSYYVNFLDIYEDYLNKIKVMLTNYIFTTMQTVKQGLKDTSEFLDYATTDLKDKNLSHLTDYIIKSDITIGQVLRLHKKMFNVDETILHIKKIRISKEQALRYNSISEMKQETYLDVDSNILLKESIRVAEKKYEENFYALYKYLNSSVILLDESLKTIIKQDKAKVIINMNEKRD